MTRSWGSLSIRGLRAARKGDLEKRLRISLAVPKDFSIVDTLWHRRPKFRGLENYERGARKDGGDWTTINNEDISGQAARSNRKTYAEGCPSMASALALAPPRRWMRVEVWPSPRY